MSRLRLFIGVVVSLVAIPAVAHADPITAAAATIASFAGLTGSAYAVGTFVITNVLYAAGSFTQSRAFGPRSGEPDLFEQPAEPVFEQPRRAFGPRSVV